MKKILSIISIATLALFSACNNFLDVKPKSEVEADVAFRDERGFQDALTGVYISMTDPGLYGRELTYGMMDVLAQQYTGVKGNYRNFLTYNYQLDSIRKRTDAVWIKMYAAIANTNHLLGNLNEADQGIFSGVNYNVIKGEALGLRAMLHFDLLRMFAPAPASPGGLASGGIPYVDRFGIQTNPQIAVGQVLDKIEADLAEAAELLKSTDPIVPGNEANNSLYLRNRNYKLNYYALKALQARVYLYEGTESSALAAANEVINSGVFPFSTGSDVINGQDRIYTTELIFSLNISNLPTAAAVFFGSGEQLLAKNQADYLSEFDGITSDYRYTYQSTQTDDNQFRYPNKFLAKSNSLAAFLYKMPLIRVSEMYYIKAECLKTLDKVQAVASLNAVRNARNVTADISESVSDEELQNQIFREYRRDMIAEGQLFYYYKRLNAASIAYTAIPGSNDVYVFPMPDDELEYGL